eukprot:226472_1
MTTKKPGKLGARLSMWQNGGPFKAPSKSELISGPKKVIKQWDPVNDKIKKQNKIKTNPQRMSETINIWKDKSQTAPMELLKVSKKIITPWKPSNDAPKSVSCCTVGKLQMNQKLSLICQSLEHQLNEIKEKQVCRNKLENEIDHDVQVNARTLIHDESKDNDVFHGDYIKKPGESFIFKYDLTEFGDRIKLNKGAWLGIIPTTTPRTSYTPWHSWFYFHQLVGKGTLIAPQQEGHFEIRVYSAYPGEWEQIGDGITIIVAQ